MRRIPIISLKLLLIITSLLTSCDTKDAALKKALKEDALTRGEKYELLNYRLLESVLISTIEDSISSTKSLITTKEWRLEADSTRLISLYSQKKDCQRQKSTTIPSLVGTWNMLIHDYDKMINEAETDIENAKILIKESHDKISHFKEMLLHAEDPIAYYVYYHSYRLDGKVCEDEIFVSTKNVIIK